MAQYIMPADTLKNIHPGSRVYHTPGQAGIKAHGINPDGEVLENPTVIPTELMRRFKHTFLVRTPQKAVPSYWKCVQEKAAGFEYFDGAEAGFEELRLLYKWISNPNSTFNKAPEETSAKFSGAIQTQPQPPPLVDASVLLAHPTETIKHLCDSTGVPFAPSMLSWESGPQAEFQKWGTYHKGAENSTGFKAETPIDRQAKKAAKKAERDNAASTTGASSQSEVELRKEDRFPQEVKDTITRNMEPYNWLYARRTIKGADKGSSA